MGRSMAAHRHGSWCSPALIAIVLASAGVSSACAGSRAEAGPAPPVTVENADDANAVAVPHPEQFPLAAADARAVHSELHAPGVVAADVSRTVPVLSLAGGRVVDVRVRLGDAVGKGQVLMTLQSPDVSQARAEMKKIEADADFARRALDRAKALSEHEALAAKDLEAAVNADVRAQADLTTARERLQLLTGSAADSGSPVVELKAPVSGVIVEQNVTTSSGIRSLDNSPNLFTIADLSRVWVLCDVNENNLADVHSDDQATLVLNAYPQQPRHARVTNISRVLDAATRTAKVRLELPNPDGSLRPGMFATVTFTSQRAQTITVVPSTAVIRMHDKDWVFVPADRQRFRRLEIRAGRDQHGVQEVLSGVRPGDRVVTNALQLASAANQP